ncbi:MAG: hypothetical protein ACXVKA_13120 [Acidimicrobiia bacterium]
MRAGSLPRSPDGRWQWDGTVWRPVEFARRRPWRSGPALATAGAVGFVIWMPTMAITLHSGPPSGVSWAWYLGLMLVASLGLGALNPGRWRLVGIGLVFPQLTLAIFSAPREDQAPWFPIFLILGVVAVSATGIAYLAARVVRRLFPSRPVDPPSAWVWPASLGIGLGAGGMALLMFGFWFLLVLPFRDAGEDLRDEASALEIHGGRIVAADFVPGSCFDNCPAMDVTYRYPSGIGCRRVIDALEARGYRGLSSADGGDPHRAHFSLRIVETSPNPEEDPSGSWSCSSPRGRVRMLQINWTSGFP